MAENDKKDTRWQKGISANPGGRPVGSKNKKTLIQEKLGNHLSLQGTQKDAIEIFKTITEQAKTGCLPSQKLFTELTGMNKVFDAKSNTVPVVNITINGLEPTIEAIDGEVNE